MITENYKLIMSAVAAAYGVDEHAIINSNIEEHVDARHILIHSLHRKGLTRAQISRASGLTPTCVSKVLNNIADRLKRPFFAAMNAKVERIVNEGVTAAG